jgi:hypothetical protein
MAYKTIRQPTEVALERPQGRGTCFSITIERLFNHSSTAKEFYQGKQ